MEPQSVCQEQAPEAFTKWVRQAAVPLDTGGRSTRDRDLEVLKHAAKSARIVALGEAARRVEEFYQLRSRLLRFLVEQMGFTAFAMESGFAEGIKINDYLLGRTGEPANWQDGFTFGFGDETETQALFRWMRQYNDDLRHRRKLHFYGIDVMVPYSSPQTALNIAFAYLDRVDPAFISSRTRTDLESSVQKLLGSGAGRSFMDRSFRKYAKLPRAEQDAYTASISDLLARFDANRTEYIRRSSRDAYEWAQHAAVAARQLDTTYRADVAGAKSPQELNTVMPDYIWEARDAAMFENISWALQQEGPSGRILLWAHNLHLFKGSVPSDRHDERGPRLGLLLDDHFGSEYFAIGTDFDEGKPQWQPARKAGECGTVEYEFSRIGLPGFLLDLRLARQKRADTDWIVKPRRMRADIPAADYLTIPSQAWDALVFIRRITPVQVVRHD